MTSKKTPLSQVKKKVNDWFSARFEQQFTVFLLGRAGMQKFVAAGTRNWERSGDEGIGRTSALEFHQHHPAQVHSKGDSIIQAAF